MLRVCIINFKGNWVDHLLLIKLGYNNSYHGSIQMAPFEALYEKRCRSLIRWYEVGEISCLGFTLIIRKNPLPSFISNYGS